MRAAIIPAERTVQIIMENPPDTLLRIGSHLKQQLRRAANIVAIAMPLFFFAMYEKNGQPLEVFLHHFIQATFIRPKIRPYKTDNYYAALMRQAEVEKEVEAIVRKIEKERNRHTAGTFNGRSEQGPADHKKRKKV